MTLSQNALLTAFRQGLTKFGLINFEKTKAFAAQCIEKFGVKAAGPHAEARSLSGGNLQKFIVGREILQQPKVLIISQPTWGVDVGASMFIRQSLIDLSRQGVAILVISEELEELRQKNPDYSNDAIIGKSGIEKYMETSLQGTDGEETVTVDNLGKVLKIDDSTRVEPVAGNDTYLTIDSSWQSAIYQILKQRVAGILLSKIEASKTYDFSVLAASRFAFARQSRAL